jgi:hypothetical protein
METANTQTSSTAIVPFIPKRGAGRPKFAENGLMTKAEVLAEIKRLVKARGEKTYGMALQPKKRAELEVILRYERELVAAN